jgi:small subunit ribosomal protein S1
MRPEDQDGNLLVSLHLAKQEKAWHRAKELFDSGDVWEGEVIGYNKGGLVVPVDDIRGFVPASQVPGFPQGLNQEERLERLADMVGETLTVKVIEINRRKRRLILSATRAQREWRTQQRERLLAELREGEVRTGRVSSLCAFGAFVDLGGADGLIHLSELSWRRIRHPREAVSVGEKVEVYVLRLDEKKKRIGLSLKRLQPEPWALVEDKYELGQLVEGVVTNVVDFGAFAEIEEGIEGLIHISELSDASVSHPKEVVKRNDLLLLRIIRIDPRRKRLGLSLKRVLESEWAEWAARLAEEERKKEAEAERLKAEAAVAEEEVTTVELEEEAEAQEVPEEGPAVAEAEEVVEPEAAVEVEESPVVEESDEPVEAEELPEEEAPAVAEAEELVEPETAVEVEEPPVAEEADEPVEAEELSEEEASAVAEAEELVEPEAAVEVEEPTAAEEADEPVEAEELPEDEAPVVAEAEELVESEDAVEVEEPLVAEEADEPVEAEELPEDEAPVVAEEEELVEPEDAVEVEEPAAVKDTELATPEA